MMWEEVRYLKMVREAPHPKRSPPTSYTLPCSITFTCKVSEDVTLLSQFNASLPTDAKEYCDLPLIVERYQRLFV